MSAADPSASRRSTTFLREGVSAWHLCVVGVIAIGLAISAYANIDVDIYWHRILGQLWLDQHSFDLTPDPIAYTPGVRDWFPTAWAPEVLFALLVKAFGYDGILGLRLVLACAFYLLLYRYLAAHAPAWLSALLVAGIGLPASLVLQDRPQTMSLVICVALLPVMHRWLVDDQVPRIGMAVALTWLWANIHGLWILVPALLFLAAAVDGSVHNPRWRRLAAGGALSVLAAALTPVGPRLLLSPFLVSSSTGQITEWRATALRSPVAWGFALTLLVIFVAVARSPRIPRRQTVAAVLIAAFGFMAIRNAVVASILLLPLTTVLLADQLAFVRSTLRLPRAVLIGAAAAVGVWVVTVYSGQSVIPEHSPDRIAHVLSGYPSVRVLAPYNSSGYLREFGGDGVRLAIDGRADRYGAERISEHLSLMAADGSWRRDVAALDPDVIVADRRGPLRELLADEGWRVRARDKYLVLLVRP